MTGFVLTPCAVPSLAVVGTEDRFPVRRVYCVGRNYAEHALEMGTDPDRDPPFFFQKPSDAAMDAGTSIPYPPDTNSLHHEIELVLAIGKGGRSISEAAALDHVFGYAVGIDLTRRDRQLEARETGRPWEAGKAFDHSAPIAPIHPVSTLGHPSTGRIWLAVNGETRQDADLTDLIWSAPEIVSILSHSMALTSGDLIMTGTPAGVGAIVPGDRVTGGIDRLGDIEITIAERSA